MYIRCLTRSFRLGDKRLRVGDSCEVSEEVLASLKTLVDLGIISVHTKDPEGNRKRRKAHKSASTVPEPVRARTEDGQFVPDDPETKDVDEAWEGGKAPVSTSGLKKSELVSLADNMGISLTGSETKAVLIEKIEEAGGE